MRILIAHNYYRQAGGEDQVFATEAALLEAYGHEVLRYSVRNDQIVDMSTLALAKATFWNQQSYRQLRSHIRREQVDIVHFHNTFPLISPAGYYAAKDEGVPVVQTLHNYRLLCPKATFFRNGRVCEDCLGKAVPWPGLINACYRNSWAASSVTVAMLTFHRLLKTWEKAVDAFITCSQFASNKFVEAGISRKKLFCKPHFLYPEPEAVKSKGNYALFVGRFGPEKGLGTLLSAWKYLKDKIPLKIVGDGHRPPQMPATIAQHGIEWLGWCSLDEVYELMGAAAFLIFPSECYETFGRVIIEAFAKGTPVLAANVGAIPKLVTSGYDGLLFRPGDVNDLAYQVEWLRSHPSKLAQMRQNARATFEAKYTAAANYRLLIDIYNQVRH